MVTAPHGARRAENRAAIDLFNPRTNKWINVWNQVLSGTAVTFAGFTTEFPMQDVAGIRLRIDPVGDTTAWQFWEGVVFHFGTLSDGLLTLQSESAIIASAADTLTVESSDARFTASAKMEAFSSEFSLSAQDLDAAIERDATITAGRAEVEIAESARVFAGERRRPPPRIFSCRLSIMWRRCRTRQVGWYRRHDTDFINTLDVSANNADLLVDNRLELTAGQSASVSTEQLAVMSYSSVSLP